MLAEWAHVQAHRFVEVLAQGYKLVKALVCRLVEAEVQAQNVRLVEQALVCSNHHHDHRRLCQKVGHKLADK